MERCSESWLLPAQSWDLSHLSSLPNAIGLVETTMPLHGFRGKFNKMRTRGL